MSDREQVLKEALLAIKNGGPLPPWPERSEITEPESELEFLRVVNGKWADAMNDARAQIEELTRERDSLERERQPLVDTCNALQGGMSPDREAALRASALLYEAEGKIAELTRVTVALRERLAEAETALRPFVELPASQLAGEEEFLETRPADGKDAGSIYSWALNLTYGDLRRAAAYFTKHGAT